MQRVTALETFSLSALILAASEWYKKHLGLNADLNSRHAIYSSQESKTG